MFEYFIVANIVYESCSDTSVGIVRVNHNQMLEIISAFDRETHFIDVDQLSFEIEYLDWVDMKKPFTGTISLIGTFYYPG